MLDTLTEVTFHRASGSTQFSILIVTLLEHTISLESLFIISSPLIKTPSDTKITIISPRRLDWSVLALLGKGKRSSMHTHVDFIKRAVNACSQGMGTQVDDDSFWNFKRGGGGSDESILTRACPVYFQTGTRSINLIYSYISLRWGERRIDTSEAINKGGKIEPENRGWDWVMIGHARGILKFGRGTMGKLA